MGSVGVTSSTQIYNAQEVTAGVVDDYIVSTFKSPTRNFLLS